MDHYYIIRADGSFEEYNGNGVLNTVNKNCHKNEEATDC